MEEKKHHDQESLTSAYLKTNVSSDPTLKAIAGMYSIREIETIDQIVSDHYHNQKEEK